MGDESIEDIQAALREASMRISAEAAAAADLYVLEKGPFALEHDGDGYMFVVKQDIRLRLKTAEEIRAEARADVFRVFNSDPGKHSITNEQHVLFCAECHALRHLYEQGKRDAAAPRTLTADEWEAIAKQFRMAYQLGACDPSNCPACDCNMDDEGRAQLAGMALQQAQAVIRIIHDGEATPQVKPCSTCGEPVAYLTARPGWAGGWLHHPARPLDGHPAAIDGEAGR